MTRPQVRDVGRAVGGWVVSRLVPTLGTPPAKGMRAGRGRQGGAAAKCKRRQVIISC